MEDYTINFSEVKRHADKEFIKSQISYLNNEHAELEEEMNNTFSNIIKKYTKDSIRISCNECTRGFYFEIEFLDESGKRVFGSDINGNYMEDRNNKKSYTLYFNVGTIGQFSTDDIYQVKKYLLLAELIKHAGDIEKELEMMRPFYRLNQVKSSLFDLYHDLDVIEREEYNAKRKAIESNIVMGTIIKTGTKYKYIISNITPKYYVYLVQVDNNIIEEKKVRKECLIDKIYNNEFSVDLL